jgi:AraC family transcriptional regulator of adaptative response / DNA-3-methyladenine glycosylase II
MTRPVTGIGSSRAQNRTTRPRPAAIVRAMDLSRDFMLARAAARDPAYDGVFLTCVKTTGIYCLPSCRAKTPKPQNVEHCRTPEEARARGFRACRRCRPDDFYAGRAPLRDALLAALQRARSSPAEFASVGAFARAIGTGATKALELCRAHLHRPPAEVLLAARLGHARRALQATDRRVLDIALDAGFEGSSAFHANFRARFGTTPRGYRALLDGVQFALALPEPHATAAAFAYQTRDPESPCERGDERAFAKALVLAGRAALLDLRRAGARVHVAVRCGDGRAPGRAVMAAAHAAVVRMLRLDLDPAAGERALSRDPRLRPHVRRHRGLRPWGTATPFECVVWAILGQQVHLSFAQQLRAALVRRCGPPVGGTVGAQSGGLVAHPDAAAVAALAVDDLLALQCSRQKAECLLAVARAVATGTLDLDALAAGAADVALAALQEHRGIGPWTANYVALRGLLFPDCLPVGDSALATAAASVFELPERPDGERLAALAARFSPHRGLFTFHLWRAFSTNTGAGDSGARPRTTPAPAEALLRG